MPSKTKFPRGYFISSYHNHNPGGYSKVELKYKRWWMTHPTTLYTYMKFDGAMSSEELEITRNSFVELTWKIKRKPGLYFLKPKG
jgi:hypothetical protein